MEDVAFTARDREEKQALRNEIESGYDRAFLSSA